MSNQPTPITDDAIRDILYRMAAHVSFFAEPRTVDLKAAAFADALLNAVRPTDPVPAAGGTLRSIDAVITILGEYRNEVGYISECTTVADIINHRI